MLGIQRCLSPDQTHNELCAPKICWKFLSCCSSECISAQGFQSIQTVTVHQPRRRVVAIYRCGCQLSHPRSSRRQTTRGWAEPSIKVICTLGLYWVSWSFLTQDLSFHLNGQMGLKLTLIREVILIWFNLNLIRNTRGSSLILIGIVDNVLDLFRLHPNFVLWATSCFIYFTLH